MSASVYVALDVAAATGVVCATKGLVDAEAGGAFFIFLSLLVFSLVWL